jgi:hypothetical protein
MPQKDLVPKIQILNVILNHTILMSPLGNHILKDLHIVIAIQIHNLISLHFKAILNETQGIHYADMTLDCVLDRWVL